MEKKIDIKIFSNCHRGVLWELVAVHSHIYAELYREIDNPHDEKAVAIYASYPEDVIGGTAPIVNSKGIHMQRIGYIARAEIEREGILKNLESRVFHKAYGFHISIGNEGLEGIVTKRGLSSQSKYKDASNDDFWTPHPDYTKVKLYRNY